MFGALGALLTRFKKRKRLVASASKWKLNAVRRRRRRKRSTSPGGKDPVSENLWMVLQVSSAAVEGSLSATASILLAQPRGSLLVFGCVKSGGLQEWYSALANPVVDYARTLKCSHELVYPLYSLPFLTIALNLVCLALLRTTVHLVAAWRTRRGEEESSTGGYFSVPYYAALWTLPVLALVHALMAGPLYYTFPYFCMISSLVLNAFHLSMERRRGVAEMLKAVFQPRALIHHLPVLLAHAGLLGFGLFSVMYSGNKPYLHGWNLCLAMVLVLPAPTLFFMLTTRLTAPLRLTRYRPR